MAPSRALTTQLIGNRLPIKSLHEKEALFHLVALRGPRVGSFVALIKLERLNCEAAAADGWQRPGPVRVSQEVTNGGSS